MLGNQLTRVNDLPTKEECEYTSCYCEENIWKLCERLRDTGSNVFEDTYAVFVTNAVRKTLVWFQIKGNGKDNLVIWDYHVILIAKSKEKFVVFDFDTTLAVPCLFSEYFQKAVRLEDDFLTDFKRVFRVIPASIYLTSFASDRSHMKDKNGQFLSPPPLYPPIFYDDCKNNFQDFISVDPNVGVGEVIDIEAFWKKFMKPNHIQSTWTHVIQDLFLD